MTDINAMIQAVLDTGELELPAGIGQAVELGMPVWTLNRSIITQQQAHDLIACEWAREIWSEAKSERRQNMSGTALEQFDDAMADGDSEAAIRAIHEALCGGKQ